MATIEEMITSKTPGLGSINPLEGLISGRSGNQPYLDFLKDTYNLSAADVATFDPAALEDMASLSRKGGFTGDTSMGGDWLGVEGLNLGSAIEGVSAVGGLVDLYGNIKGIGQKEDLFGKQMGLLDQQLAANKYAMEQDKASKAAFSGATSSAFKKEDPRAGLGAIG